MRTLVPLLLVLPLLAAAPAAAKTCYEVTPLRGTHVCDNGEYRVLVLSPWVLTGFSFACCGSDPSEFFTICTTESAAGAGASGTAGVPAGGAGVFYHRSCTTYPSGPSESYYGTTLWAGLHDTNGDGQGDTPVLILP